MNLFRFRRPAARNEPLRGKLGGINCHRGLRAAIPFIFQHGSPVKALTDAALRRLDLRRSLPLNVFIGSGGGGGGGNDKLYFGDFLTGKFGINYDER
jgi:hypothetical protein